MPLVEVRQLTKTYTPGRPALAEVSFTLDRGAFAHLRGPSGAGKTTLLALLGGLDRPTAGSVLFAGRDLAGCADAELARVRRRIGFVFQDSALIPGLPLWENLTYGLIPLGVSRSDRRARAAEWLARVGLGDRLTARPHELSGGEQQRSAVARALLTSPELVLADEPTASLDHYSGAAVLDLLHQAWAGGATVVLASHDARAASLATRTIALGPAINFQPPNEPADPSDNRLPGGEV